MDNYNSAAKVIKFAKNSALETKGQQESAQASNNSEDTTQAINSPSGITQDYKPPVEKTLSNDEYKIRVAETAIKKIAELRPLNLYKALLATQKELPTIYKSAKAYNYKYVTYEALAQAVFPCMHKHGLLYTATIDGAHLVCNLIHAESGQALTSAVDLNVDELNGSKMLYPQKIGSLISYYKRYMLGAFLGLGSGAEDVEQIQAKMAQPSNITRQAKNIPVQEN